MRKMRFRHLLAVVVTTLVLLGATFLPAQAGVKVYAEGAYTENDLAVYVYADITTDAVCSAGVKVTYDPAVVTVTQAEKNGSVWFMGAGTAEHSYMDPEIDAANGTIIIICGKLDTDDPNAGVIGNRVLLGKIFFDIVNPPLSTPVANPESYFGVTIALGRGGSYTNFATTTGTDIDSSVDFTSSGVIIRERGDANTDGVISNLDIFAVKDAKNQPYSVFADCNNDGAISNLDIFCVKDKK